MKTIYLKLKPLFKEKRTTFHIKVTETHALDITDDAINIIKIDNESEYHKYIADAMSKSVLAYVPSTQAEFDEQFIETVGIINSISNQ